MLKVPLLLRKYRLLKELNQVQVIPKEVTYRIKCTEIVVPLVTATDMEVNYLTSQLSLHSKNERPSSTAPTMSSLEHMHKNLTDTFQASRKAAILKSDGNRIVSNRNNEIVALSAPTVWVSKWVDYSNKYGLGYELTDGTFGAFFNDGTRIALAPNERYLICRIGI